MKGYILAAYFLLILMVNSMSAQVKQSQLTDSQSTKRIPTVEQWISLKSPDTPGISPDGRFVVYTIQEANWEANSFESEIWITTVATGERRQLTDAKGSSRRPSWSPDGKHLAFISNREGSSQVYMISPPNGEVVKLTKITSGVNAFQWSPDSRHIAFASSETSTKSGGKSQDDSSEFIVVGEVNTTPTNLWVIGIPANGGSDKLQPEQLTDGKDFTVDDFSWSPDSSRIAFSASSIEGSDVYSQFTTSDIYVLNPGLKSVRKIVDQRGPSFFPVWSPDGKKLAFKTFTRTNTDEYLPYAIGYIAEVSSEGGLTRLLTEQFDEDSTPVAWSPDGIYFTARQKTYQHLFRLNPATKTVERTSEPFKSVFFWFSFTKDFRQAAFVGADAKNYQEIYVSSLKEKFEPKRLTPMGDQLKDWKISTPEVIEWKSQDGLPIEGVLFKPADFDPSKKYPLLVIAHSGPLIVDQATITRDIPYPAELFAAKGAFVLRPNYRGSIGYGGKFREALVQNLGIPQYQDVITGVDYVIAQGTVDSERVGIMGWSHGGYVTAFSATYGNRFRAASVGAGVSDWTTFYTNSDGGLWAAYYLKATPWDDPEYYKKTAPLSYIKQAKTPILIQHGEFDKRAPIAGAYELHQALKDQNVPVKFVVYKSGHIPSGLKQMRLVVEHNIEWFKQWIWNEKQNGK